MYQLTQDLQTGNTAIDNQHRQLIDTFNQLLDSCSKGKGRESIRGTLIFLQDYTIKHFNDEESLQVKYNYPDYPAHKVLHETFKHTIDEIIKEYDAVGPTIALVSKINLNLGGWLINHIKREDAKVAAHIKDATL